MTDIIKAVKQFSQAAGQTTDHFNPRQAALYTGLQFEELAEKLEALMGESVFSNDLHWMGKRFKEGDYDAFFRQAINDPKAKEDLLDADVDLAWVTIGAMLSQGANVSGAVREVERANLAKLIVCPACKGAGHDATPATCTTCSGSGYSVLRDENGKIRKPSGWSASHLAPFIHKE